MWLWIIYKWTKYQKKTVMSWELGNRNWAISYTYTIARGKQLATYYEFWWIANISPLKFCAMQYICNYVHMQVTTYKQQLKSISVLEKYLHTVLMLSIISGLLVYFSSAIIAKWFIVDFCQYNGVCITYVVASIRISQYSVIVHQRRMVSHLVMGLLVKLCTLHT